MALGQPAITPEGSGLVAETWAGEDLVANPVCLAIDEDGRVFVAESFRQSKGIEDNRSHAYWLLDDLATESVDDRLAAMKKWDSKYAFSKYSEFEDRITRLADTDGDGKADARTIYSDGYNEPLDGTGAGLIARDGKVWFTCIPSLVQLGDTDDDGVADEKKVLHTGFGVRWALRGHDLHGLVWGAGRAVVFFGWGSRVQPDDAGRKAVSRRGRGRRVPLRAGRKRAGGVRVRAAQSAGTGV